MPEDNTILKIILAGAGCLVLVIGIGAFIVSKFYLHMHGPTKTVEEHIRAINHGNYELAYTHFSRDLKEDISYQDFRNQLEGFSSLLPSQQSSFPNVKIVNNKATVEGMLVGKDGAIFPVQYELIKEKGTWKISMYRWISPGDRIRVWNEPPGRQDRQERNQG
jgi:Domain of unknown function (DUF4864)